MKLKRINVTKRGKGGGEGKDGGAKKGDALISRFAAGFCFDVLPSDCNMLVVKSDYHIGKLNTVEAPNTNTCIMSFGPCSFLTRSFA